MPGYHYHLYFCFDLKCLAPEEFFDEVVEKDKMYFDAVTVLTSSGLEKITVAKVCSFERPIGTLFIF